MVFSHGATIMFWTMMNVDNPDLGLLLSHPLDNTSVVVIAGDPEDGWTLQNWDGVEVAAEPSLSTKLFVDVRDVVTAPQTAAYRIGQAVATGDAAGIAKAIRDGAVDVTTKVVGFAPKVVTDVVGSLHGSAAVQSDEQAPAAQPLGLAKVSATEPTTDAPKDTTLTKKTQKSNRVKDMRGGNKFHPGDTASPTHEVKSSDTPRKDAEKVTTASEQTADTTDVKTGTEASAKADAAGSDDGGQKAA